MQLNDEVGVHVGQPGHLLCLLYVLHTAGTISARSSSSHKLGHPVQLHDEVVQHVGRHGHLLGLVVASPSSIVLIQDTLHLLKVGVWVGLLVHLILVEIINCKFEI